MLWKKSVLILVLAAVISLIGGCGGAVDRAGTVNSDNKDMDAKTTRSEPVELVFYSHWLNMTDEYFKEIIGDPIHKKYPHITLKFMMGNGQSQLLPELLAAGQVPDIIYAAQFNAVEFKDKFKAVADMSSFIKSSNLDLNKFEPSVMDSIKTYGSNGEIYALPFAMSPWSLYYNKDLFDRFGVPYPKDGMTWDEVTALAKLLTREQDGVQYKGILLHPVDKLAAQLSLPYVDAKSLKPVIETDGWKKLFTQMKQIYEIPGILTDEKSMGEYNKHFEETKTLAMLPGNNKIPNYVESEKNGLNWDVVSYPSFPDKPNLYPGVQADSLMMSPETKHKDDVFKVISYLVSDESQQLIAKKAKMSALKSPEMKKVFGADYPSLKGKNLQGIFKSNPAALPPATGYDTISFSIVRKKWEDAMFSRKDINSAIREAQEEVGIAVEQEKAK